MVLLLVITGWAENFVKWCAKVDMTSDVDRLSMKWLYAGIVANGFWQVDFRFQTARVITKYRKSWKNKKSSLFDGICYCWKCSLFQMFMSLKLMVTGFFSVTRMANGGKLRMSASYYFNGDCTNPSTRDEIKRQFIETLNKSKYALVCQMYAKDCTVDNVQVLIFFFVNITK